MQSVQQDLIPQLRQFGVTEQDLNFFQSYGKDPNAVLRELLLLTSERTYPQVLRCATVECGDIRQISLQDLDRLSNQFGVSLAEGCKFESFIPASGAATRLTQMLKTMLEHDFFDDCQTLEDYQSKCQGIDSYSTKPDGNSTIPLIVKELLEEVSKCLENFWKGIVEGKYPYLDSLRNVLQSSGHSLESLIKDKDVRQIARYILGPEGLNYKALPKLLMEIHRYDAEEAPRSRLALEEHLRESANIQKGASILRVHFTISEEHQALATDMLKEVLLNQDTSRYLAECGFNESNMEITWSYQDSTTDSVALDLATSKIARQGLGNPILRKSGHGALVKNLSDRGVELSLLSNVDNVVFDRNPIKNQSVQYKRAMSQLAVELSRSSREHIGVLLNIKNTDPEDQSRVTAIQNACDFAREKLNVKFEINPSTSSRSNETIDAIIQLLDRPIVVAGFVPLEKGVTGGGPFIINKTFGAISVEGLSILEQAEFREGKKDPVFNEGRYFNPVILAVGRLKHDGALHDLNDFVDHARAFVTSKNSLSVYERAGLWNGGMANCHMIGVKLPAGMFAPIKDMAGKESFLSQGHQPFNC